MKTRKEKIEAIYEKIARKDLSFGCKFRVKKEMSFGAVIYLKGFEFNLIKSRENENIVFAGESFSGPSYFTDFEFEHLELIGHPVMIGDVLTHLENIALDKIYNYIGVKKEEIPDLIICKTKDTIMQIFKLWENKINPIEDQSDECVDFVYNLII